MRLKIKVIISLISILLISIAFNINSVKAVLQSCEGTPTTYDFPTWFVNIRNMETLGGTLGLSDTINTADLTSSAEISNKLDVHMEKNSEYGALVLLSASSYGNPNKVENGETTTGNKSGVVMKTNEVVSAGTLSNVSQYVNANAKYKDIYSSSYVAKPGDAISETAGWYGGSTTWMSGTVTPPSDIYGYHWNTANANKMNPDANGTILRGYGSSVFSYYGYAGTNYGHWTSGKYGLWFSEGPAEAHYKTAQPSRAVIVNGDDL